ncbi:DUF2797 domain-containing protein [Streptomyces fuscigenes]|uniref:DUF2797 domain-containing protein n=1 Tax=Streptomyces fuscigenes TaxID=1528880 RepID=UPI001F1A2093|nr:DUF2797 domain-containing protein [Streptomyces fuscigenes]MCF3961968.1 DUF2797 domain-containing protein [Streptomyces fuscigenes]
MSDTWRCAGLRWGGDGSPRPRLVWESHRSSGPEREDGGVHGGKQGGRGVAKRLSELVPGRELAFRAVGPRRCIGAGRERCPLAAEVSARSTGAQCSECARLDRLRSVAADTIADDPRPYRVYLAWFGPGMRKVGITAEARGPARLLEQGAVTFSWLGRGPLMAARRTEELLRAALGVPDRIPYADKRVARADLPPEQARAAEVAELHARALALPGWPGSLEPLAFEAVDHARVFGLERGPEGDGSTPSAVPVDAVVSELVDGGAIAGRLVAVAGPDLHVAVAGKGVVVVDSRLMRGWGLERVSTNDAAPSAPAPASASASSFRPDPAPASDPSPTSDPTPGAASAAASTSPAVSAEAGQLLSLPVRELRRGVQGGLF